MVSYRRHIITVVQEASGFSVEVRNKRGLVGALPVSSEDEGIEEGKGLVDLKLQSRQR